MRCVSYSSKNCAAIQSETPLQTELVVISIQWVLISPGPNEEESWWELALMRVFINSHRLSWSVGQMRENSRRLSRKICVGSNLMRVHEICWERIRVLSQTRVRESLNSHQLSSLFGPDFMLIIKSVVALTFAVSCHVERPRLLCLCKLFFHLFIFWTTERKRPPENSNPRSV